MRRGKIGENEQEVIRTMTEAGATQRDIAEKIGVTDQTIAYWQKKLEVKSNSTNRGGKIASVGNTPNFTEKSETRDSNGAYYPSEEVITVDKTLKVNGVRTGFNYTIGLHNDNVLIETGYGDPFRIDLKDLAGFSNELIGVLETIQKMKKDIFCI